MQPIKYRQYHPSYDFKGTHIGDEFHYWGYIYPDSPTTCVMPISSENASPSELFTGMFDRDSKEIYVGDILALGSNSEEPRFIMEVKIEHNDSKGYYFDYGYPHQANFPAPYWVKVIGNIHQNAELLK